jgi:hypothetical protein
MKGGKVCKMTQENKSQNLGEPQSKIRCYLEVVTRLRESVRRKNRSTKPKIRP